MKVTRRTVLTHAVIAVIVFLLVVVYIPTSFLSSVHSAIFGPFTVTYVTTTTVITIISTYSQLNDVTGQVTSCAWNHTADWIQFTITATRTPSAPSDGKVLLLYLPNQHIYGPGGLFTFSSGSLTTTVNAVASDSGFVRSRACIVSEWSVVFFS